MEKTEPFTLTKLALYGRMTIKFGGIGLVLIVVAQMFISASIKYWAATHPPAPPPPTVGFGALPQLHFPVKSQAEKPTSYQLQILSSRFPKFSDRSNVYLMTKTSPDLLADQRVRSAAKNLGFSGEPNILSSRTYRWSRSSPMQATLEMDTQNNNFTLFTDFLSRPELLTQKNLPDNSSAVSSIASYVGSIGGLPTDLSPSLASVQFLKSLGNSLGPAVSFSDADFLQVDIARIPIDKKSFYAPGGTRGIVHGVVSGGNSQSSQIVELEYQYHEINYTQLQTYPIRTPEQAWQVLQAGEGYIAQKGTSDVAIIRNVTLGYYDDTAEQDYMQPIYVFSGDNGFLGYVPAIDPRYVQAKLP